MTEQERERLIDARIHVERIRDADGDWVGADMEWHESVHGLSAADVDEIETEAYRRHLASRQPATPEQIAELDEAVRNYHPAAPVPTLDGIETPDLDDVVFDPLAEVTVLERRFLDESRNPTRAITFPAQMSYVFTPETERMLARLINPTTLGERLCRAFLMGDEVALQALVDGIKGGEIEVQP